MVDFFFGLALTDGSLSMIMVSSCGIAYIISMSFGSFDSTVIGGDSSASP